MTSARLYVDRSPLHDSYQHPGCVGHLADCVSAPVGLQEKLSHCKVIQLAELLRLLQLSGSWESQHCIHSMPVGSWGLWAVRNLRKRLQQQSHRCHQLWRGRVLVSACVAWFWVARHNHTKAIPLLELELDCPLTRQALSPHDLHGLQGMKGQLKVGMFYKGLLEHNGLCLLQRRVGAPWEVTGHTTHWH